MKNRSSENKLLKPPVRAPFEGLVCGALVWMLGGQLGLLAVLPFLRGETVSLFGFALGGALLASTRARVLGRVLALGMLGLWLLVAFSPLASRVCAPLVVEQAPEKADAVVVVQAGVQRDDDFGSTTLARTLHAMELVRQGFAPRLILTEDPTQGSHQKAAQTLMRRLGLNFPVEAVGPVRVTHDEAVRVARLLQGRGARKVLLVTSPLHSRRAQEVFQKTGLVVVSCPCREGEFDLERLDASSDRLHAFAQAMREVVGLRVYRARGWI